MSTKRSDLGSNNNDIINSHIESDDNNNNTDDNNNGSNDNDDDLDNDNHDDDNDGDAGDIDDKNLIFTALISFNFSWLQKWKKTQIAIFDLGRCWRFVKAVPGTQELRNSMSWVEA